MEDIIKLLDIRKIEFLHLGFINKNGNFMKVDIDYPCELADEKKGE